MIPLHPEATGDPRTLRWVVPPGLPLGRAVRLPDALHALVTAGVVEEVLVEPAGVLISLSPGRSWRVDGPGVRTALQASLENREGWGVERPLDADATLRAVAEDVLAGETGDYVRSHGGSLAVSDVSDGVVTLAADGTCAGCPAVDFTLQLRVAAAIRKRCAGVVDVRLEPAQRARRAHRLAGPDAAAPGSLPHAYAFESAADSESYRS